MRAASSFSGLNNTKRRTTTWGSPSSSVACCCSRLAVMEVAWWGRCGRWRGRWTTTRRPTRAGEQGGDIDSWNLVQVTGTINEPGRQTQICFESSNWSRISFSNLPQNKKSSNAPLVTSYVKANLRDKWAFAECPNVCSPIPDEAYVGEEYIGQFVRIHFASYLWWRPRFWINLFLVRRPFWRQASSKSFPLPRLIVKIIIPFSPDFSWSP